MINLLLQNPKKATKAFLKQKPLRSDMDIFKENLIVLLDKISIIEQNAKNESEEHLKNDMRDFLLNTFYKDSHAINTKDKKDLVIHLGKKTNTNAGVIIEAKRPSNTSEMISVDNANKKALHEIILYYFKEREGGNNELKQLIISNIYEWYIIDANYFDKFIYQNKSIKKIYDIKQNDKKDNPWFYQEIAKALASANMEIPCVYFDLKEYEEIVRDTNKENDSALSALLKVLSPQYLLKVASLNDSNSLNEKFYKELLHIIGLEEVKAGGKNIICKKKKDIEHSALIEMALVRLKIKGIHKIPNLKEYGENLEEQYFNIALELCIVWINRLLFLKLLEGQLVNYHRKNKDYCFLNKKTLPCFQDLFILFHEVLAIDIHNRHSKYADKYKLIPYLNSSLFEISEIEDYTICINDLDNHIPLKLISTSVLKDTNTSINALPPLDYLFQFLDAYDFASEGTEEVQEDNKTLINASVLGKVFEKINGYKDGSIFTPAFITMYMCRESIQLAVVEKFNAALSPNGEKRFATFEDVKGYTNNFFRTEEILNFNSIVNDLKICDPAVGSGHFLVSTLNEIISIKAELGILCDENGISFRGYEVEIVNDELIITNEDNSIVEYKFSENGGMRKATQRLQKALFHEKQTLIESCLFGVDINPNSVKICRLRLWIELLKNAYYKEESNYLELETLPNLDINIKCGNSLLSRFDLKSDLSKALKSIKYDIKAYRGFVSDYRVEKSRDAKRALQQILHNIKTDFKREISKNDSKQLRLNKLSGDLYNMLNQVGMFDLSAKEQKEQKEKQAKLEEEIRKLAKEIEDRKNSSIYNNAFEWRFEFPEVLNDEGDFLGFDVVIANPPYIRQEELGAMKEHLKERYSVFISGGDIFYCFYQLGYEILKDNGMFAFINNTFDKTTAGSALREFTASNLSFKRYIDFTEVTVFEEATTYPIVLIAQKQKQVETFKYFKFTKETFNRKEVVYLENAFIDIEQASLNFMPWSFLSIKGQNILNKIYKHKTVTEIYGRCYRGIQTGLNEAFIPTKDLGSSNVLKSIYEGKDIKKWLSPEPSKKVIAFKYKSTKELLGDNDEDTAFKKMQMKFPEIMNHLKPFSEAAKKRHDRGEYWWELRSCAYYNLFELPKLIFPNLQHTNKFAYDKTGVYLNAPAVFIPKDDKYLLGVLNSKVVWFFLKTICVIRSGGYIEVKPQYFEQIPIPEVSIEQQQPIIKLVDEILALKEVKEDVGFLSQEIEELEVQIDALVYDLYELSTEERRIIAKG